MSKNGKSVFDGLLAAARAEEEVKPEVSSKKIEGSQGKRQNPEYRQTTIYIRKDLHKKVKRILEDSGFEGDFSDWVEQCMLGEIANHQGD
ncbi:MAG: hypothetical protein QNJ63_09770 [Calothrix sp. MO_192.B10]|nr:hypothetical protein [Calothrix sp. MO_192.B10]